MKIALLGYGKMGQAIEKIAIEKGHEIVLKIDVNNQAELTPENLKKADVAIEFTGPHSAVGNVQACINAGLPVVCGSTGWLSSWQPIQELCHAKNGALIYASNYSIGVNVFFAINTLLAKHLGNKPDYNVQVKEIHHTQKLDAPSGTAITIAEQILAHSLTKKQWVNNAVNNNSDLEIISQRIDPAPGTHSITYSSAIDDIEIIHTAHNRTGFAGGAVLAAEFLVGKTGIFTMKDVLGL
jgi:4-hydroxy-tetrahydrodipicolinate reductase